MIVTEPPARLDVAGVRDFWDRCLHDVCTATHLPEVGVEGLEADAGRLVGLAAQAGGPFAAQGAAAGISRALEEAWEARAQVALSGARFDSAGLTAPSASPRPPEPQRRPEAAHRAPTPEPVRERHPA